MEKKTTKKYFDFRTIKSFEDACKHLGIEAKLPDVSWMLPEFQSGVIGAYKLFVIFKAINNGWRPDWSTTNQRKYFPWLWVSSSGFGFAASHYDYSTSSTNCSSRLCTDSEEKARYIADTFGVEGSEYKEFFLYNENE